MSLRSILGGSRVKKNRKSGPSRPRSANTSASPSPSPRRRKSQPPSAGDEAAAEEEEEEDLLTTPLPDHGLAHLLATAPSLRDVPQALRAARATMFAPLPTQRAAGMGFGSGRVGALLRFRAALPPVAGTAHVAALLGSPSATEREVAELVARGVVRRVLVRGAAGGELLVEVEALVGMVEAAAGLEGEGARGEFVRWLRGERGSRVPAGRFAEPVADALVRAGFLTAHHGGGGQDIFARPEDRTSAVSLAAVARAASGSVGAVGGAGAVHAAGGSGARGGGDGRYLGDFHLAVPGNGAFLALVAAALGHLTGLLAKTPYREAPESMLRERWDGGVPQDEGQYAAKRARGEFVGPLPARTKKWKDFYGLNFEWILAEAVGVGLVELFETGSVGRGVRLT